MAKKHNYTGTHFGVFNVSQKNDGSVQLQKAEFDSDPTPMMKSFEESLSSPLRIQKPAIRLGFLENGKLSKNTRGQDPFVEVEWDQALDIAAKALDHTYTNFGASSVYGGSYGWASAGRFHHAQSQIHRFLNVLGGYTASINTYSHAAAEVLLPHIIGHADDIIYNGTTWPVIRDHTKLIVSFGGLPSVTGQVSPGGVSDHTNTSWIRKCAKAGVKLITIGPTTTPYDIDLKSQWISPCPNTDTALMLALAYHLVVTDTYDKKFINKYTVGFDTFLPYLMGETDGQPKSPSWAAHICSLEENVICELAKEMVRQPCLITATWALQRADFGEQSVWMLVVLAAMIGQIGLPGGGLAFGLSSFNGVANPVKRLRYASLPQGKNSVKQRIPVARICEMLENPGGKIEYNGRKITFPDIKAVYWAGGNPFHHHQDLNRLRKAWCKPDLVIVNELEWNSTARHADIVFPVAGPMERNDVMAANSDRRLIAMKKYSQPVGQARTDYEIFTGLAKKLGVEDRFTDHRTEKDWLNHLHEVSQKRFSRVGIALPSFDRFWADGCFTHCNEDVHRVALKDFRKAPDLNTLPTESGKIEIFSKVIDRFGYADCPGHPKWLPPREWLGKSLAKKYPLHLISPQPKTRLHGQLDGNGPSAASKIHGREPCFLNAMEAAKRSISDRDIIRIYNGRGETVCGARIVDWVADKVIVLPTGAWFDPGSQNQKICCHGNPNVLTSDKGTSSLSQGPTPNSTLVQVEKFTGSLPEISVHKPPSFVKLNNERGDIAWDDLTR